MNTPNRNENARYKTIDQMMQETNMCRDSVKKIALEADALIKYGRVVRILAAKFYQYLDKEYKCYDLD